MRRHLGAWATATFVPLWSTGILFGAVAIRHGPPFAVTTLRIAAAAVLLAVLAAWQRAAWPRGAALFHAVMVGLLLLQGAHYAGIAQGMPAGVAGLVVGLISVATAVGAAPLLGEAQTLGLALAIVLGAAAARLLSAGGR